MSAGNFGIVLSGLMLFGLVAAGFLFEREHRRTGVAFFLAWFVPGAGHLLLGRPVKAAALFLILAGLYTSAASETSMLWALYQMASGGGPNFVLSIKDGAQDGRVVGAEIVVDVQILEVNRTRLKQYGIDLNAYAVNLTFSPEVAPPNTSTNPGAAPASPTLRVAGASP